MSVRILVGDCRDVLTTLPDASVDALVTDPPAGIGFMGVEWDTLKGRANNNREREGVGKGRGRVADTWDRTGSNEHARVAPDSPLRGQNQGRLFREMLTPILEECRRVLRPGAHGLVWALPRTSHWTATALEDAGFDIRDCITHLFGNGFPKSKQALKPAAEFWWLVRAPLAESTVAANVVVHGTGALSIEASRIAAPDGVPSFEYQGDSDQLGYGGGWKSTRRTGETDTALGRWPANVVLDEEAALLLDEQSVGASRFFYAAKAPTAERDAGLYGEKNDHPTVKSLPLSRWLCRLITPPGGTILDPFMGSGSTGCAAAIEGFSFVGIEQDAHYADIADRRIRHWGGPLFADVGGS